MRQRTAQTQRDKDFERRHAMDSHMVPPADPDETWFRHYNWQNRRTLIRSHLVAAGHGEFALNRWDECGSECLIEWSETEKRHRLRANYCRNKHCEPCAKAKAALLTQNLRERLKQQPDGNDRYRFITLTLKHSEDDLKTQITRLYKCFSTLRKSKLWKSTQRGGAAILEVKWSPTGRKWHPHLHIIGEGDFLRQSSLATEWHRITGDSKIVDVRALNSAKDAAHYVSKYVTKGTNAEVWNDANAAIEWICATKGVRTCSTYGNWRGFALLKRDRAHDATDWQPVALLRNVAHAARNGSMADILLLEALQEALQYNPHKKRKKPPNAL